jgi:hypothetical protein
LFPLQVDELIIIIFLIKVTNYFSVHYQKTRVKFLELGSQVGIISYNNSPFKEILAGGISVLSTDFNRMGSTLAKMVLTKSHDKIKKSFFFYNQKFHLITFSH